MLKHASNAGGSVGGPANGQLRNSTSTTTASNRNIHLRPQQPLNISTLSTNTQNGLQTSSNSATLNGGQRIPTLLNIASTPIAAGATNTNALTPLTQCAGNATTTATAAATGAATTTTTPITPLTPNGIAISLLLALLSLIFLLKISPNAREDALTRSSAEDFVIVYDVTLALCALSLSLNLCCLLVCAIQFLFAVKLVRSPMFDGRDNKYLEKSSASRTCAVGGFFISIPIFLTGIILYTFNHFHSTPAIITSVLIGIGIVFCGGAMVHNVFIWQKEKTISYRSPPLNMSMVSHIGPITPPAQFLSPHHAHHFLNFAPHMHSAPTHTHAQPQSQTQTQLGAASAALHPTSVTPVSPNHSHGSFNALLSAGALNSSFLIRPSTATPPTPKPLPLPPQLTNGGNCLTMSAREASGSVSPGIPGALDMSNITSPSLHELSTLV
ncbi:uncharacterized protein LOC101458434 isoform X2 [Ceratitis capitata]|uniref:Uncharacterized protein n=1 Tax=Ceratitis capitata TaxID=7213 RepID=W8BTZ2_CERCA|nr:uncharacterized protein LOC101458434 isoform X2 [Ceratitis capitata]